MLKAVEQDGMTIRCASKDLQENFDVGMAACKNNPAALKYLNTDVQQKVEATLRRKLYDFDHIEIAEEPKALDSFLTYFDIVEVVTLRQVFKIFVLYSYVRLIRALIKAYCKFCVFFFFISQRIYSYISGVYIYHILDYILNLG